MYLQPLDQAKSKIDLSRVTQPFENNPPQFQISGMGSFDPKYQEWLQKSQEPSEYPRYTNALQISYLKPPDTDTTLNPSFQKFSDLIGDKNFFQYLSNDRNTQLALVDLDNLVKSNAGIFRTPEDGLQEMGVDVDGSKLYAAPEVIQAGDNFKMGENQLMATGALLSSIGAFGDKQDSDSFVRYAKLAGSPEFQGQITAQIASGDKRGAVDSILASMGKPTLDAYKKSESLKDKEGLSSAYSAYSLVNTWDAMNGAQRSMALSGMAINGYKYATGENLTKKVLAGGLQPGDPKLTVGTALGLANAGVNVMGLVKNWDQMDAIQRTIYGVGSVAQMATVAKQFGLLGAPDAGGKAVKITAEALGQLGFRAVPSAGTGAIVGPAQNIPDGYTVVAAGTAPNTVVAVPIGHEGTTATMNGTNKISSLNAISGTSTAALGAYQIYSNWGKGGVEGAYNGVIGGTAMGQGLAQLGQTNPYMLGTIVALSALGGTLNKGAASTAAGVGLVGATGYAGYQAATGAGEAASGAVSSASGALGAIGAGAIGTYGAYKTLSNKNLTDAQKGTGVRRVAEDAAAAYMTSGLSALVQFADQKLLGGKLEKLREKSEKLMPGLKVADKLAGKAFGGLFGGGNKSHMERSSIRKGLIGAGVFDEGYNVTLADGSKVYAGFDNDDGQHDLRDPSQVPVGWETKKLSAYDVDYTNDLDFSAALMTGSLMRLLGGGKGKAIDEISGQLANATLGNIGYGQDMTEGNYGKMQANARALYVQSGIKTKEDGYALANQAFAEGRFNEMDLMHLHQGLNMAFDDTKESYDKAQQLMAGRRTGIVTAASLAKNPSPVMSMANAPSYTPNVIQGGAPAPDFRIPTTASEAQEIYKSAIQGASTEVFKKPGVASGFTMEGGHYWYPPGAENFQTSLSEYKDPWVVSSSYMPPQDYRTMTQTELKRLNSARYG